MTTQAHLDALAHDLREIVHKLAGVEEGHWPGLQQLTSPTRPPVIEIAPPGLARADAILIVIQRMLSMKPGDTLSVEWHDQATQPDGSMATLTMGIADPPEPWQSPCSA